MINDPIDTDVGVITDLLDKFISFKLGLQSDMNVERIDEIFRKSVNWHVRESLMLCATETFVIEDVDNLTIEDLCYGVCLSEYELASPSAFDRLLVKLIQRKIVVSAGAYGFVPPTAYSIASQIVNGGPIETAQEDLDGDAVLEDAQPGDVDLRTDVLEKIHDTLLETALEGLNKVIWDAIEYADRQPKYVSALEPTITDKWRTYQSYRKK